MSGKPRRKAKRCPVCGDRVGSSASGVYSIVCSLQCAGAALQQLDSTLLGEGVDWRDLLITRTDLMPQEAWEATIRLVGMVVAKRGWRKQ